MPALEEALPEPQNIPLDIVFEDEDLLVINKPAGLVVHPGAGNTDGTLVNALLYHCQGQLSGVGGVKRPGIVHRIDKETSGLLVVAKNDAAHRGLSEQLADRSLGRVYTALCWGVPIPALGKVDKPIARDPKDRLKMCVRARDGRDAVTHYKTVQAFGKADAKHKANGLSLIECKLETGRTHQIRVHMQFIGHSLIGDPNYAAQPSFQKACLKNIGMESEEERNVFLSFPRQALHARKLHFIHPRNEEHMMFEAPLPDDLQTLVQALNIYS
jgi:23S rRNA pseudouridine1911/1915/1917 synthase